MTKVMLGNEDQPEDDRLNINLEEAFINKYGAEEGRRQYNKLKGGTEKLPINLGELIEKKKKRMQELHDSAESDREPVELPVINLDKLIKEKEERMQELYGQAESREEPAELPVINLDEIYKKQGIKYSDLDQSQKELLADAVKTSVDKTLKEYRKSMQASCDSDEIMEESVELPVIDLDALLKEKEEGMQNLHNQSEEETEKLDKLIGKKERMSRYGITSEELRSRPVALSYETFDGTNTGEKVTYVWNAVAEKEYSLLEEMSCVETVAYLLTRAPLQKVEDGKLVSPGEQNRERLKIDKCLLKRHAITTKNAGILYPEGKYTVGGKPNADERERPLLEYLRPAKDSTGKAVWHQKFSLCLPFSIDELVNKD